jgi:hypothetical protein
LLRAFLDKVGIAPTPSRSSYRGERGMSGKSYDEFMEDVYA